MEWTIVLLVIVIGFAAGFINTLAGSGSLLTLPLLIFIGLPANVANGTNRIAILFQNIIGVASFKKQQIFQYKEGVFLSIPAIIGSVIGAFFAVDLDEQLMKKIIGGLLVFMFFMILYKPQKWITEKKGIKEKATFWQIIIFFFIGIYGGFIQAGVGFFLLAGLVLNVGYELVKANAIKVFIVLLYTIFALSVFIFNKQVNYTVGFTLAIGNMLGAYVATKFAVKNGAKYIRYILLITIGISALKLFGFNACF